MNPPHFPPLHPDRCAPPHADWLRPVLGGLAALAALALSLSAAETAAESPAPTGMVLVPAGEFTMGANDGNYDEAPAHPVRLSAYYIDRCEVTVAEFAEFVRAADGVDVIEGPWFRVSTAGCLDLLAHYERRYGVAFADFHPAPPADEAAAVRLTADTLRWKAGVAALRVLLGRDQALADGRAAAIAAAPAAQALIASEARKPVAFVTWRDGSAYARWAGKRLPTEAEWEKAARGTDSRIYPWGNDWDTSKARVGLTVDDGPATVGNYPQGASAYGCLDLAGNVWEWCSDWYGEAYYRQCAGGVVDPQGPHGLPNGELPKQDPNAHFLGDATKQGREPDTRKVVRGGCWVGGMIGQAQFNARCARRMWSNPNYWSQDTGFRCVKDLP